ncbi:hypothetical protein PUG81_19315 [Erwiniaceae bacterium L1_54_6]|nr:hypothetical protein [Erwiniaceae bacterium L1_54_6]
MKTFLFFHNKEKFRICLIESISQHEIDKMKSKGFNYQEIEANNTEEVILKIKNENRINIKSLKEYSGDTAFSALIESLLR